MDARNINNIVEKLQDQVVKEITNNLPRKVGVVAVNQAKNNFRESGYLDNGIHKWKQTKRQQGKGTNARYGPLTSSRNHLMSSVQAKPSIGQVIIENPVPYASIHNNGGNITTHPTITPKMRKYAWHMVYSLAGIKGNGKLPKELPQEAQKWKGLALTSKSKITVRANIPKRQFLGDSAELRQKINNMINQSLEKIKHGIITISSH
jgi:phage gpG-like protein